jgi:hypothetical protein
MKWIVKIATKNRIIAAAQSTASLPDVWDSIFD